MKKRRRRPANRKFVTGYADGGTVMAAGTSDPSASTGAMPKYPVSDPMIMSMSLDERQSNPANYNTDRVARATRPKQAPVVPPQYRFEDGGEVEEDEAADGADVAEEEDEDGSDGADTGEDDEEEENKRRLEQEREEEEETEKEGEAARESEGEGEGEGAAAQPAMRTGYQQGEEEEGGEGEGETARPPTGYRPQGEEEGGGEGAPVAAGGGGGEEEAAAPGLKQAKAPEPETARPYQVAGGDQPPPGPQAQRTLDEARQQAAKDQQTGYAPGSGQERDKAATDLRNVLAQNYQKFGLSGQQQPQAPDQPAQPQSTGYYGQQETPQTPAQQPQPQQTGYNMQAPQARTEAQPQQRQPAATPQTLQSMMQGQGALPPEQVTQLLDRYAPNSRGDQGGALYKTFTGLVNHGDTDTAGRLLQSMRPSYDKTRAVLQAAVAHGDWNKAFELASNLSNLVPDGRKLAFHQTDGGGITAVAHAPDGKVTSFAMTPEQFQQYATGPASLFDVQASQGLEPTLARLTGSEGGRTAPEGRGAPSPYQQGEGGRLQLTPEAGRQADRANARSDNIFEIRRPDGSIAKSYGRPDLDPATGHWIPKPPPEPNAAGQAAGPGATETLMQRTPQQQQDLGNIQDALRAGADRGAGRQTQTPVQSENIEDRRGETYTPPRNLAERVLRNIPIGAKVVGDALKTAALGYPTAAPGSMEAQAGLNSIPGSRFDPLRNIRFDVSGNLGRGEEQQPQPQPQPQPTGYATGDRQRPLRVAGDNTSGLVNAPVDTGPRRVKTESVGPGLRPRTTPDTLPPQTGYAAGGQQLSQQPAQQPEGPSTIRIYSGGRMREVVVGGTPEQRAQFEQGQSTGLPGRPNTIRIYDSSGRMREVPLSSVGEAQPATQQQPPAQYPPVGGVQPNRLQDSLAHPDSPQASRDRYRRVMQQFPTNYKNQQNIALQRMYDNDWRNYRQAQSIDAASQRQATTRDIMREREGLVDTRSQRTQDEISKRFYDNLDRQERARLTSQMSEADRRILTTYDAKLRADPKYQANQDELDAQHRVANIGRGIGLLMPDGRMGSLPTQMGADDITKHTGPEPPRGHPLEPGMKWHQNTDDKLWGQHPAQHDAWTRNPKTGEVISHMKNEGLYPDKQTGQYVVRPLPQQAPTPTPAPERPTAPVAPGAHNPLGMPWLRRLPNYLGANP